MDSNSEPIKGFLINKELLEFLLRKVVEDFKVESGTNPGDNYTSIIHALQVKVKGENKAHHILIKSYPNNVARREFLDFSDWFGKEFFFYNEWAHTLAELSYSQCFKSRTPMIKLPIPEFLGGNYKGTKSNYPAPWSNESFIVMTDLRKTYGFRMASREEGLDFQEVSLALKELATIHALSWCYKVKNNLEKLTSVFPHMIDALYSDGSVEKQFKSLADQIMNNALKSISDAVGMDSPLFAGAERILRETNQVALIKTFINVDGVDEGYANRIMRIPNDVQSKDTWLLGCHGDYWVNNILFRYDENNNPTDAVIVDFQIYREACPTTDLVFLLYSSTTAAVRSHVDSLLKIYFDEFSAICEQLRYKPLPGWSLDNLKQKFRRSKILGFALSVPILTMILKPAEEAIEVDTLEGNCNEIFTNVMSGGDKNNRLRTRLAEMATELYLDGVI